MKKEMKRLEKVDDEEDDQGWVNGDDGGGEWQ